MDLLVRWAMRMGLPRDRAILALMALRQPRLIWKMSRYVRHVRARNPSDNRGLLWWVRLYLAFEQVNAAFSKAGAR